MCGSEGVLSVGENYPDDVIVTRVILVLGVRLRISIRKPVLQTGDGGFERCGHLMTKYSQLSVWEK